MVRMRSIVPGMFSETLIFAPVFSRNAWMTVPLRPIIDPTACKKKSYKKKKKICTRSRSP